MRWVKGDELSQDADERNGQSGDEGAAFANLPRKPCIDGNADRCTQKKQISGDSSQCREGALVAAVEVIYS